MSVSWNNCSMSCSDSGLMFPKLNPNSSFFEYNNHLYNGVPFNEFLCPQGCYLPATTFLILLNREPYLDLIVQSILNKQNNVVNRHTYLRRLTSKGTVTCMKRVFERMLPEIKITMDRLTNPYYTWAGSQVPFMQRVYSYVVLNIQECMKQPATRSIIQVRSPKIII